MARKEFFADIVAAAAATTPHIGHVTRGDDYGEVKFSFFPSSGPAIEIKILAIGTSSSFLPA
jgi:hypothetical protein